jgi:glycosyltransferase involved in cell wall biosynthesis
MLAEALEATLRRLGWDRFWLLVAGEFAAAGQLARSRRLRGLIYLDLERAGRPLLRTPEAIDVAERADLRVSSAYPAAQHFEATLGPSRWLPLGTPGFFLARLKARPPQEPGEPPVTRPYYVLYPGTIDATVDLELLAAVAQRTPEITYLLAGKIARPLAELAPLKALDNVRVLGPLAEADWHRWLLETDTGFLPLQPAAGGAVQLPAGLMLLLGKGKPVVSSMWVELPGMERARYFRKANAPASLARLLRQAIAHDTQSEQIRRIRFARERDWHEQARKFLAWLPAGR